MNEDAEIVHLVKDALEKDSSVSERMLRGLEDLARREARARRFRRVWWQGSSLLVASLVLVLSFALQTFSPPTEVLAAQVGEVVRLLYAADDLENDWASAAPSEMLLSWQDAPCADLL